MQRLQSMWNALTKEQVAGGSVLLLCWAAYEHSGKVYERSENKRHAVGLMRPEPDIVVGNTRQADGEVLTLLNRGGLLKVEEFQIKCPDKAQPYTDVMVRLREQLDKPANRKWFSEVDTFYLIKNKPVVNEPVPLIRLHGKFEHKADVLKAVEGCTVCLRYIDREGNPYEMQPVRIPCIASAP